MKKSNKYISLYLLKYYFNCLSKQRGYGLWMNNKNDIKNLTILIPNIEY